MAHAGGDAEPAGPCVVAHVGSYDCCLVVYPQLTHRLSRIESLLKGEMRLLQDDFAALAQRATERFDCELRNGIFIKTREIEKIKAEIGVDGRG